MPREKQYASYKNLAPIKEENKDEYACMEIQNLEHLKKIVDENLIVCIDLYANWCKPCKILGPQFTELAKQYNIPGKCLLAKEDFDLNLKRDIKITGIPTIIFYLNGQLLRNHYGNPVTVIGCEIQQVREILNKLLSQVD